MNTVPVRIRVTKVARYSDLSIVRLVVSRSKIPGCRWACADAAVDLGPERRSIYIVLGVASTHTIFLLSM